MKKIVILALHLGYGGIEKSIAVLANLLASTKQYTVEIASIYQLYEQPVFPLEASVTVKYLLPKDFSPNKEAWQASFANAHPIQFVKESLKGAKILYHRKKEMATYLKQCQADVIISTRVLLNELASTYGSRTALKIGWEHNHHHNDMKYAESVVRSAKNLDYLVVVSKDLQRFYRRKLIQYSCKCIYIPNTIEKIPNKKSSLTAKRLISIGRLAPEKGYLDLLKIYFLLHKKEPEWTLDIVGDGKERGRLERFITLNHLEDCVRLHGFQDSEAIDTLLQNSSIYLMTSYTESFGIVLLEAMSHGLPCIAFDSAEGAKEIITSGHDGYLIRHRNFDIMIRKIRDLMKDKEKRLELGANGRKKVKLYSKEVVSKQWINVIEKK